MFVYLVVLQDVFFKLQHFCPCHLPQWTLWICLWVVTKKSFQQNDFLEMNMLVFVFAFAIHSCKVVNLALFRCGVCPVASKSTVYLLCITLLLLPAHVCLGFLDRSPGPTDHTCGERELSTRTSSSITKKKKKNGKARNCSQGEKRS